MVDQLNRLLGDLLSAGTEVYLPCVGTLRTERHGARRIARGLIVPPACVVVFSSAQGGGASFVDLIAEQVRCQTDEAQQIFDRWLARTYVDDVLTVEGVGSLRQKHFTPDAVFDARLNPQGHDAVKIATVRRMGWPIWLGVVAVVFGIGICGFLLWDNRGKEAVETPASAHATSPISDDPIQTDVSEKADVTAVVPPPEVEPAQKTASVEITPAGNVSSVEGASTGTTTPTGNASARSAESAGFASQTVSTPQAAPTGTATQPASLVSGRNYVVIGVYSTSENAARAVDRVAKKAPEMPCGVYRFGDKLMLSPFDAADEASCARYIATHRDRFPDLWMYTAR